MPVTVSPVSIEIHEDPGGMVVQGTLKTLTVTITDPATGVLKDPTAIEVVVGHPAGTESILQPSDGSLTHSSTGVYRGQIDTIDAFGTFGYEVITDGDRRHRAFDVKPTTWPAPISGVTAIDGGNAFSLLSTIIDGGSSFSTTYFQTIDGGGA